MTGLLGRIELQTGLHLRTEEAVTDLRILHTLTVLLRQVLLALVHLFGRTELTALEVLEKDYQPGIKLT